MIASPEQAGASPAPFSLQAFIRFVLDHCLEDYVRLQLQLSREMQLPILQFFDRISEEDLVAMSMITSAEFLEYMAEGRATEHLEKSLKEWRLDQLPVVGKNQLGLDDLLLITAIRKRSLIHFLKRFTADIDQWQKISEELDDLFLSYNRATTNTYVQMLQDKLTEENLFKEKLSHTSPGFYFIYDLVQRKQVMVPYKLFSYLGYQPEEYMHDPNFFSGLVHPDDIARSEEYLAQFTRASEGEIYSFEYRLRASDGSYKWMRNYESVLKHISDHSSIQLIGVAFDVSKEHFFVAELQRREEELLMAQDLAQMGSFLWDFRKKEADNTPQTVLILGLQKNDKFDDLIARIHPSDRTKVTDAFTKALNTDGEYECEYRIDVGGKGKIIWSRGKVHFEDGQPMLMKGTVMDVTDKHHMLQKLVRSEELYKQAQALNKLGNWTWEIGTDKLYWSDELYRIYGLEPQSEHLSFERFVGFIHPDDRAERLDQLQKQLTQPGISNYYFRIIAADGKQKVLYGQSEVLRDSHDVPYKIVGTCQDVTQQKELENSLKQKTVQLEKSNESLQQFAYICSHDLKEPLRKISVMSDRLDMLMHDRMDEQSSDLLSKIMQASSRLHRMIDDVLSVSRISVDKDFSSHNLGKVLEDVLQGIDMEAYGATIEYDSLPDLIINETQFQQLFQNLLLNALKFRKKNVAPVIRVRQEKPDAAQVRRLGLNEALHYTCISFSDNGIGFDPQYGEKIFSMFQRLHDKSVYEGTGIGLTICKRIAEHHHGGIYAESQPGEGARFCILIPTEMGS